MNLEFRISASHAEPPSKESAGVITDFYNSKLSMEDAENLEHFFKTKLYSFNYWNASCSKNSFVGMGGIILDIDDTLTMEEAKNKFKQYKYIIHTSTNHQIDKETAPACDRFRIILPFDPEQGVRFEDTALGDGVYDYVKELYPFIDDKPMHRGGKFYPAFKKEKFSLSVNTEGSWFNLTDDEISEFSRKLIADKALAHPTYSSNWVPTEGENTFNNIFSVHEILLRNGYQQKPSNSNMFNRPGSTTKSYSVRVNEEGSVWSFQGDALNDGKLHNAFDTFKILEHGGSFKDAIAQADKLIKSRFSIKIPSKSVETEDPLLKKSKIMTCTDLLKEHYEPLKFAVPGIIPEGLTVLSGPPKAGKSLLVYDFCIAIATGTETLGIKCEKGKALYFSLEDSYRRLQARLIKILGDRKEDVDNLLVAPADSLSLLDTGGIDELQEVINDNPELKIIIIDTIQHVKGAPKRQNAYEEDVRFLAPLQALAVKNRVSIVGVTHTKKDDTSDILAKTTGSFGMTGTNDNNIILERTSRIDGLGTLNIVSREIEDTEMSIHLDSETLRWQAIDDFEVNIPSVKDTVLDVLRKYTPDNPDGIPVNVIIEEVGMKRAQVDTNLFRLKNDGVASNPKRGLWKAS